jgi:hypothetical protein
MPLAFEREDELLISSLKVLAIDGVVVIQINAKLCDKRLELRVGPHRAAVLEAKAGCG